MTEYTGWDNYIEVTFKRQNHPYSCGFHASLKDGVINQYFNPYGHGYRLKDDDMSWFIDYCPFCGVELED